MAALSSGRTSATTRWAGMPTWPADGLGRRARVAGHEPDLDAGARQLADGGRGLGA